MGLEIPTYISDLVVTNPTPTDLKSQGDDHLRYLKSAIKTTFPNITGVVSATHGQLSNSGSGLSLGIHNIVTNGGFTVNQRGYVSGATLAVGAVGHDRWIAGAGGGDYTFTQLESDTLITIGASKTLIQIIEPKLVQGASLVLSWTGTCQARCATNGTIPASAYFSSPTTLPGQTVGTVLSIEFGLGGSPGTLGKVQIERAASTAEATSYEQRPFPLELAMCQRDYCKSFAYAVTPANNAGQAGTACYLSQVAGLTAGGGVQVRFPVEMRTTPTVNLYNPSAGGGGVWYNASSIADSGIPVLNAISASSVFILNPQVAGDTVGRLMEIHYTAATGR